MHSFVLFLSSKFVFISTFHLYSNHFQFPFQSLSFSYDSQYVTSVHSYLVYLSHVIPIFLSAHLCITWISFRFSFHVYLLCSTPLVFKIYTLYSYFSRTNITLYYFYSPLPLLATLCLTLNFTSTVIHETLPESIL